MSSGDGNFMTVLRAILLLRNALWVVLATVFALGALIYGLTEPSLLGLGLSVLFAWAAKWMLGEDLDELRDMIASRQARQQDAGERREL